MGGRPGGSAGRVAGDPPGKQTNTLTNTQTNTHTNTHNQATPAEAHSPTHPGTKIRRSGPPLSDIYDKAQYGYE